MYLKYVVTVNMQQLIAIIMNIIIINSSKFSLKSQMKTLQLTLENKSRASSETLKLSKTWKYNQNRQLAVSKCHIWNRDYDFSMSP